MLRATAPSRLPARHGIVDVGKLRQLVDAAERRASQVIFKHYGERVLGYQHRTLTQSPIEGAELTKALAAVAGGADVHCVTRGADWSASC